MIEETVVILKPDAVARGDIVIVDIFERYSKLGLKLMISKRGKMTRALAQDFYKEHTGKPFFDGLIAAMCAGPSIFLVLAGEDAIKVVRRHNGATDPAKAEPGTIRHDFRNECSGGPRNLVHGSDSHDAAVREKKLLFGY